MQITIVSDFDQKSVPSGPEIGDFGDKLIFGLLLQLKSWFSRSQDDDFAHPGALGGWLVGWLTGWLVGWLVGWSVGWLPGRLAGWLAGWLGDWLAGRLVGWLVGWLAQPANQSTSQPSSHRLIPT